MAQLQESKPPSRDRMIITIDGPAGSGKSTTAKMVADALGYLYLDTGAMYRAFTLAVIRNHLGKGQTAEISALLDATSIALRRDGELLRIVLNGEDVSGKIRSPDVDRAVTWVCQIPDVRQRLVQWQRQIAAAGSVVAEGRDQGSVVFPDAALKFYLTADLAVRGHRRWLEQRQRNSDKAVQDVTDEIDRRDRMDAGREISPLTKPADAIQIDTTQLTMQEQAEWVLEHIRKALALNKGRQGGG